ncbi:MAG TPA: TonB-dependent receptor, partial [Caulobacteraceae bacterium]
ALGVQHRIEGFETRLNEWYNREINPCIDTPTHGTMDCANPNGPLAFLGVNEPEDLKRNVNAVFGELSLPVLDSVQVQLAARYENYGSKTGSTFDPKLSVRWQITDIFAVRGSVGSTFRAPSVTQITDNFVTSLQNIGGTFRAVDVYGNPGLEPETATTYSIGFIADVGGFNATLDYWNFDFDNPIVGEPVAGIVNTMFPGGASTNCGDPDYAGLQSRFTFSSSGCGIANVQRLHTDWVNGARVQTSGWDLLANYDFGDIGFADLNIGVSATYVSEYKSDANVVEGLAVETPFDAVGLLNYQTTAYPLPQWKGELFFELTHDIHNLRWTTRYIDSYVDQRTAQFATNAYHGPTTYSNTFTVPGGKEIDSNITSDLTYRALLPMDTTVVVSVENIFDEDPSFARLDLNYDPFTGDPLGRNFKLSVTKKF